MGSQRVRQDWATNTFTFTGARIVPRPTRKVKKWVLAQFLEMPNLSPKPPHSLAYEITQPCKTDSPYSGAPLAFWDGPCSAECFSVNKPTGYLSLWLFTEPSRIWAFNPMPYGSLEEWDGAGDGREVEEGGNTYKPLTDSHWSMAETNMTFKAIILQLKAEKKMSLIKSQDQVWSQLEDHGFKSHDWFRLGSSPSQRWCSIKIRAS